jgi:chromosome segregation protein
LEFNSPISAIVGPNGSGKSNIAESFRFVLGEQSIKSLRGKRGEDLIFNGSNEMGRLNKASVKLVFDNRKRFLNIDFDEVIIERVVHRDSVNEYFINGSLVRLKDILELLANAHIGSSGHHIISQGEADKILNAAPKDRKDMIEDALGLKIYQYKRKESERKLEKTEENMKSVESLRKEIAPHIKFLKKQVEKVEKVAEMKNNLLNDYREYLKREDVYLKFSREKINAEQDPLKKRLKELEEDLQKARDILAQSVKKDAKSDELLALEEKTKNLRNEKSDLLRNVGRIEGEITSLQRIVKKQQELASSNLTKTVALREVEILSENIGRSIKEAEGSSDLQNIKQILVRIKDSLSSFISSNKEKVDDSLMQETDEEIAKLMNEKKTLSDKIHSIGNEEQILYFEYEGLKAEIEKEKDSGREAEKNVFKIMTEQNEILSKLNQVKTQDDKLTLEEENFKRELTEAAVLIGRDVLNYGETLLTQEEILNEPRSVQEERRRKIEKTKIRIEDAGPGGEEFLKEYNEVTERDQFLERELGDLSKSAESLKQLISELEEKLNTEFKEGVQKINRQFQEFFALMFGGGEASLDVIKEKKKKKSDTDLESLEMGEVSEEMIEEDEEGEEGVEVKVSLPRKKIKSLVMLSGGERALTSIALLFAISQVNPPPFIILDETDAALDEANSKKYGDMISNLSKYSQLIVITHNRETMSRAGILYGITMGSGGISKILSIQLEEAVQVAK